MIKSYLKSPVTRQRLYEGLAAPYVDEFADWMRSRGFKKITIEGDLRSLAGWTDWMKERGHGEDAVVEGFEKCRSELKGGRVFYARGPNKYSIKAASKYIQFLQERGVVANVPPPPSVSELWPILGEFRSWSLQHRGTRETTLDLYETTLRDLVKVVGDKPNLYSATSLRDFVLKRAKPHSIYRAQAITVAVRAFLRFLSSKGLCHTSLIYAIPRYPSFQLKSIPRYLEPADVQRVIMACVAEDENGLRDRAVMLLLSRLGLRAGDVAALSFSDIDWKNGRLAVLGKSRRQEWLPLPQDVGDAILKYLKKGRSPLKTDRVFIKVDAPVGPLTRASVTHIARSALRRAGIKAPVNGAHLFRHSAATAMLRAGVSLPGIGAVLRQRSSATTTLYAKVDFGLLSEVAQAWPEVVPC